MTSIYAGLVAHSDDRLVLLAAFVCLMTSGAAMSLLAGMEERGAGAKRLRLLGASIVMGFGLWASQFIVMLACQAGYQVAYGPAAIALFGAIGLGGASLVVATGARLPRAPTCGGIVFGVAAMLAHCIGAAAFRLPGSIVWEPERAALALVFAAAFGMGAMNLLLRAPRAIAPMAAGLVLAVGICGFHLIALSAAVILPDATARVPVATGGQVWLAVILACAAIALRLATFVGTLAGIHRRRRAGETRRMRELANAAVEGLIICEDGMIVTANENFERLVGLSGDQLRGRAFVDLIVDADATWRLADRGQERIETHLHTASAGSIPVELIAHEMNGEGRMQRAIAVRDLRDRKRAEAQIEFLAHHDPLTGVANRARFSVRLQQELSRHRRRDDSFAVLCLDLDRFKEINDVFGHAAGDRVLQAVVSRILDILGRDDLLARLGGDEFAIIRTGPHAPDDLAILCSRILGAIGDEIDLGGQTVLIGISIGVACFPVHGADETTLINHADAALYRAKNEGRNTYRVFEAGIGAMLHEKRVLEHDLRQALARGELNLVYQPQATIDSGKVRGFEVLLRWQHPVRGAIPPSVFIPVAEETGQIVAIGEWVLRNACAAAARWSPPLSLSVNISAVQLYATSLPSLIADVLAETGLAPGRLELEITETALVRDTERALQVLRQIKAMGVRMALDDFGTGYSSLSNLQVFPFDKIKIDRSFVHNVHRDEQAAIIVRAVLGLGRGLNLTVVAEGVETREELEFLAQEHCPEGQGYYFARPADSGHFWDAAGNLLSDGTDLVRPAGRWRIVAA